MSFRTGLLARVDRIRQIPQRLDLRQNRIFIVVRQWTDQRVGLGTYSDNVTELFIDHTYRVRVQQINAKDVVASGGLLTQQDVKVGPFTPEYITGGVAKLVFDPPPSDSATEVLFHVTGHSMGPDGRWFKRLYDMSIRNFTNMIYLQSTGVQA